jgi:hypothetical protein
MKERRKGPLGLILGISAIAFAAGCVPPTENSRMFCWSDVKTGRTSCSPVRARALAAVAAGGGGITGPFVPGAPGHTHPPVSPVSGAAAGPDAVAAVGPASAAASAAGAVATGSGSSAAASPAGVAVTAGTSAASASTAGAVAVGGGAAAAASSAGVAVSG